MGFLFFASSSFLSHDDRISSTTITSSSQRTSSWLLVLTRNSYCWWHLLSSSLLFSLLLLIIYYSIISKKTKQRRQRQQQQQKQQRQNRQQTSSFSSSSSSFTMQRLMLQQQKQQQRKLEFLSRCQESDYGYKRSPGGYIDDWRPIEFPSLISPINLNSNDNGNHTRDDDDNYNYNSNSNKNKNRDKEIYFDYAGSAIPTQTQLLSQATATTIYANPHSTGPAASRTFQKIKEANHLVLKHFNGLPDGHKLAMLRQQQQQESSISMLQEIYNHSGYEILFTSGTTESLRLIAEHFPWNKIKRENNSINVHNINHHHQQQQQQQQQQHACTCGCHHQRSSSSILLYANNSHNSVIGMRQVALNHEAKFYCRTIQQIENMTKEDYINLKMENKNICSNHDVVVDDDRDNGPFSSSYSYPNLLAFPMECNFGGYRSNDISKIIETARSAGFYVLLDVAKAAGTGPVDFKYIGNPDFVCCSFYKMFGLPTGLGALFVNRHTISTLFLEEEEEQQPSLLPPSTSSSSTSILSSSLFSQTKKDQQLYYVGGGSVDINLPKIHYCVPRTCPSPIASWTSGSVHFRGIIQLHDGFKELVSRGGMNQIHQHTTCLSNELVKRLEMLYHTNGRPVAEIYRYNDATTATNNTNDAERQQALESQANNNNNNNNRYGPTVAFNLLRDDGSIVGYNEVSKLAALSQPPIQFRTGCFCNPGACQEALGITDEQAISNYETSGHVCGGHLDVIDGRPTGAIRISFGKDSIWEDLDTFLLFVQRTFVNHHNDDTTLPPIISKTKPRAENGPKEEVRLSEIYVFPIKSCAAQSVSRWKLELPSGKLFHDREFALVDSSGTAMRLQSYPKMALIQPVVDLNSGTMRISAPGCEDLVVDLNTCGYHTTTCSEDIVKVCGNKCGGRLWGDSKVSEWFSSYIGVSCWLARYSNGNYNTAQQLLQRREGVQPKTSFANEQPILLISQNAVDTLNEVLRGQNEKLVGTRHFRPNLVVQSLGSDDTLHVEDDWVRATVSSKGVLLSAKGACARCAMVDFDPTTGSKHGKTLKALARYRRRNGQITFGIFLQASTMIERGGGNSDNDETEDVWLEIGDELKYDI